MSYAASLYFDGIFQIIQVNSGRGIGIGLLHANDRFFDHQASLQDGQGLFGAKGIAVHVSLRARIQSPQKTRPTKGLTDSIATMIR